MTIHQLAEGLSLALTAPTIILSLAVVVIWRRKAFESLRNCNRTPVQWLILGVAVSFTGSALDNIYWGIAWSSSYLEHPARDELFRAGVYFNIPFRQIAGVIAAFCHLKSAAEYMSGCPVSIWALKSLYVVAFLLGVFYLLALAVI